MSEIIKPTIVDGIEFYVAPNGEAGMSQRGLARLCGVDEAVIRRKLSADKNHSNQAETQQARQSRSDQEPLQGANGARIIPAELCGEIIEYYAFNTRAGFDNSVALFSFRKFAKMGIERWIHQVTGYSLAGDTQALLGVMSEVLTELKELRKETAEYKAIKKHNDDHNYAGLTQLLGDFAEPITEAKLIKGGDADQRFTVSEYLASRGMSLDKQHLHKFANLAALTYRTLKLADPVVVLRESTTGQLTSRVKGYLQADFPILAIALQKTVGGKI